MIGKLVAEEKKYLMRFDGAWTITPYAYCGLRCTYCSMDSQGRSRPMLSRRYIDQQLRVQLRAAPPGKLILGRFTDLYPPEEAKLQISRHLLQMLAEENIPFLIVTKSDLVLRDVDILAEACDHVTVSTGITDEKAVARIEPLAPSFARRVEVVRQLIDAGVTTNVSAAPWIPGLSDTQTLIESLTGMARVVFCVLSLMEETESVRETLGWSRAPAARRAFGKSFTQRALNEAYLAEAASYFDYPNTAWVAPINTRVSRLMPMCSAMGREDLEEALCEFDMAAAQASDSMILRNTPCEAGKEPS